eukprot:3671742-Rhodomonas_salina.2
MRCISSILAAPASVASVTSAPPLPSDSRASGRLEAGGACKQRSSPRPPCIAAPSVALSASSRRILCRRSDWLG